MSSSVSWLPLCVFLICSNGISCVCCFQEKLFVAMEIKVAFFVRYKYLDSLWQ